MIFQCSLCLKVQQMSKYGSKVFKNLVFDDTRPLWNQLLWWNNAATFLNDIETSKMRENAKNSKTISMKRKSIFVKLIFRHAIMRNIINVKTPLHGIKQTDAAPHHSICMIYVYGNVAVFFHHILKCLQQASWKKVGKHLCQLACCVLDHLAVI